MDGVVADSQKAVRVFWQSASCTASTWLARCRPLPCLRMPSGRAWAVGDLYQVELLDDEHRIVG